MTVRLPKPLSRLRFMEWVRTLPDGIERAKGFFRFANEPELQEFQFFPPRTSTVTPVILLDEPEHAVVLIGRGYDSDALRSRLIDCLDRSEIVTQMTAHRVAISSRGAGHRRLDGLKTRPAA